MSDEPKLEYRARLHYAYVTTSETLELSYNLGGRVSIMGDGAPRSHRFVISARLTTTDPAGCPDRKSAMITNLDTNSERSLAREWEFALLDAFAARLRDDTYSIVEVRRVGQFLVGTHPYYREMLRILTRNTGSAPILMWVPTKEDDDLLGLVQRCPWCDGRHYIEFRPNTAVERAGVSPPSHRGECVSTGEFVPLRFPRRKAESSLILPVT